MGLVIGGERSGVGKTTVVLAILAALGAWGERVQGYKVGPDYIDPMFHYWVTGRPAYNLDPVLTSPAYVQRCYHTHLAGAGYALVEGVMGLFDGAGGTGWGSTAAVAQLLGLPVVLVIDGGRLSQSVAALVQGYRDFDPRVTLAGVIVNRVGSDRHQAMLRAALAPLGIPILGMIPRQGEIALPDRHLGLVPTDELPDLAQRLEPLAHLGQTYLDWERLRPLLAVEPRGHVPLGDPQGEKLEMAQNQAPPIKIAIARDRAFNFYYPDNLEILETWGATLVPWSPLGEATLPPGVAGLYFGGGFPEMFGQALGENQGARRGVAAAIAAGMPTLAECGGLMYLGQTLTDLSGQPWPMVGALPLTTAMTPRLTLGYRRLSPQTTSVLIPPGEPDLWGHEFHRSAATPLPPSPLYITRPVPVPHWPDPPPQPEGWAVGSVHAAYSHVHWGDRPHLAARFVACCREWRMGQGGNSGMMGKDSI